MLFRMDASPRNRDDTVLDRHQVDRPDAGRVSSGLPVSGQTDGIPRGNSLEVRRHRLLRRFRLVACSFPFGRRAFFMLPGWQGLVLWLATPSCPWRIPRIWLTCRRAKERVLPVRGQTRLPSDIQGMWARGFALQAVEVHPRAADR